MREKRKNAFLWLGLLLLLTAAFLLRRQRFGGGKAAKFFPQLQQQKIVRIVIKKEGEIKTELKRTDSGWVVATAANAPADEENIKTLLDDTALLDRSELISTNPEKQSRLGVDEKGFEVQLWDEKEKLVADYFVGYTGVDFNSTYVRIAGENRVYLTPRVLTAVVNPLDWRNLTVLSFRPPDIDSWAIKGKGGQFILKRSSEGEKKWIWEDNADFPLAEDKIEEALLRLSSLRASDLVMNPAEEKTGLSDSNWRYIFTFRSGMIIELTIGQQDEEGRYYVQTNQSPAVYLVAERVIKNLPQQLSDLRRED